MSPQLGDYACRKMGGTPGKLISLGELLNGDGFSEYDHAEIFVGKADRNGPFGYTMGAYPGGARLVPLSADQLETGHGFLWSSGKIPLSDVERQRIVYNALLCRGIGYSSADYFALALHRFRLDVPELKGFIASTHSMICSQLVDWCYMTAGVKLFQDGRWPGYVTPAALADLILNA